jgi:hypothetical protein
VRACVRSDIDTDFHDIRIFSVIMSSSLFAEIAKLNATMSKLQQRVDQALPPPGDDDKAAIKAAIDDLRNNAALVAEDLGRLRDHATDAVTTAYAAKKEIECTKSAIADIRLTMAEKTITGGDQTTGA